MFIAMNRFRIKPGKEADFERVWAERDSHLDQVPGFREFKLLRGASSDEQTLYISHSIWESREKFEAWTRSDAFRKAHGATGSSAGTVLGHPEFEGYEKVL